MSIIPIRYHLPVMLFVAGMNDYMQRTSLSVNIVAMVPVGNVSLSDSQNDSYLHWTAYQRANILGAFFWGYLVSGLTAAPLAERWSARFTVFLLFLVNGLLTLVSPPAAKQGFKLLLIIRIIMGYLSGIKFMCFHKLISKWATPNEKGLFIGALIGGSVGTVVSWSFGGFVIAAFGWEWGFYAFGLLNPIVAIVWWFVIYDTPEQHPRISVEEKTRIANGIQGKKTTKSSSPILQILTSIPVWSLVLANFGVGWGLNFVATMAPAYIGNTLGYNIKSTGILSAIIYLCRSASAILAGSLGDFFMRKKLVSMTLLRKGGVLFSHIIPGCALLFITYTGFPTIVYVLIIIISLSINGAVTWTTAVNAHDLTTNYAGTIAGLTISASTTGGILTPLVVAYFTKEDETNPALWHSVFYLGAAVYIITGLQFIMFSSTKKQAWDAPQNDKAAEEELNIILK